MFDTLVFQAGIFFLIFSEKVLLSFAPEYMDGSYISEV